MAEEKVDSILDQDEAMESYFDGLLSTLDAESEPEKGLSAKNMKLVQFKSSSVDLDVWEGQMDEAERLEAEKAEAVRLEAEKIVTPLDPNAPVWAATKFGALIGVVNNVNVTFPATAISGELEFRNDLKKVDGQPDWVLGLKMTGKDFVAVIDVGNLLLNQPVRDIELNPYKKILRLDNSRWGIALDAVSPETEILSSHVKWREKSLVKQWLCGVESDQQLVIVDPAKMFLEDN